MTVTAPATRWVGTDGADHGFFGPGSVTWRVLSTPAVSLMIAQITNLLEVPHIDFQSVLLDHDPLFVTNTKRQRGIRKLGRRKDGHFHDRISRTVVVPLPIVFGDTASAHRCASRLRHYHEPMRGVNADDGQPYSATSPDAMLFGAVTISHAALIAYEQLAVRGWRTPRRLADHERDRYFSEMAQLAVLMGVPADEIPRDAAAVAGYYRSVADKFTYRRGWTLAQLRTAAPLVRPIDCNDLRATVSDIALMASTIIAYAVLPKPSRRLHRLGPIADPAMAAIRLLSLPLFAALNFRSVCQVTQRWLLGPDSAGVLAQARISVAETHLTSG